MFHTLHHFYTPSVHNTHAFCAPLSRWVCVCAVKGHFSCATRRVWASVVAGWWQTTISRQAAVKLSAHWWFMLLCNWVLIKSVSGAHVMVCFSGPCHVWALGVIGCYRCCECVSGLKEWVDRLRCDCSLRNASQRAVILLLLLFLRDKGHKVFCLSARS